MGRQIKHQGFGARGVGDQALSLAEQLLSGKPMGRGKRAKAVPKLTPRPTPKFGRRDGAGAGASDGSLAEVGRTVAQRAGRQGWRFWIATVIALGLGLQALAGILDWPSPTLGGRQLWTDIRVQGGWRAQCHAWTGHCRILDDHDVRRTWGAESAVVAEFDEAREAGLIPAAKPKAMVLIHGLGRSAHSFDRMAEAFAARGYEVVTFNYASTRAPVAEHARALNRVVGALDGVGEVSFVTHSLGAVVLRQALADDPAWTGWMETGRSVLLAGPNQGSAVAAALVDYTPARWVFGPALGELANGEAVRGLPVPPSFATVAGTHDPLWFFDEPADGLVSTAEARLDGAAKHLDVDAAHTFIMSDPRVIDFAVEFINGA